MPSNAAPSAIPGATPELVPLTSAELTVLALAVFRQFLHEPVWQTLAPGYYFTHEEVADLLAFAASTGALLPTGRANQHLFTWRRALIDLDLHPLLIQHTSTSYTLMPAGAQLLADQPALAVPATRAARLCIAHLPLGCRDRLYSYFDLMNQHTLLLEPGLAVPDQYGAVEPLLGEHGLSYNACELEIDPAQYQAVWTNVRRLHAGLRAALAAAPAAAGAA